MKQFVALAGVSSREGLFVGKARYASGNLTLDGVTDWMQTENRVWRTTASKFPRSSIHNILGDRAYIGEVEHKGEWYPGTQEPLIDRATWNRVQTLLGNQN